MCETCYDDYGRPNLITEKVKESQKLIDKVYEYTVNGGYAHIVIDDFNIEDCHIEWCLRDIEKDEYDDQYDDPETVKNICRECLLLFKSMSIDERATALALYDKII